MIIDLSLCLSRIGPEHDQPKIGYTENIGYYVF